MRQFNYVDFLIQLHGNSQRFSDLSIKWVQWSLIPIGSMISHSHRFNDLSVHAWSIKWISYRLSKFGLQSKNLRKCDHITEAMKDFHWLKNCIQFKVLVTIYQWVNYHVSHNDFFLLWSHIFRKGSYQLGSVNFFNCLIWHSV